MAKLTNEMKALLKQQIVENVARVPVESDINVIIKDLYIEQAKRIAELNKNYMKK